MPEPLTQDQPVPFEAPPPAEESQWHVGTLSYRRPALFRLCSWLLWGDFAWAIKDRFTGPMLQLLLKRFQASDTLAGLLAGTFPAAIGLLLGPIISFRSDNYRSVRGRRLPFLLWSAPAAAVAIFGLGFSPALGGALHRALGTHSPGLFPSTLVVLAAWWIAFDFTTAITNAVFTALINDVVPHGVIGRFYGLFRAVSLLVGIGFNYWLFKEVEEHYLWMFVAIAAIYGVGVVLMCLNVREGEYPPAPPVEGSGLLRFFGAAREYFQRCFSHPFYWWYFAGSNLALISLSPINLYSIFFAKSLGIETAAYGKYVATFYVVSLCITYPLGMLVDWVHPLRATIVASALYGVAALAGAWLAVTPAGFGAAFIAHGVISGIVYTVTASINQRMLPRESFAQFASASAIIAATLNMTMPPALGYCLDLSHHNYRLTFLLSGILSFLAVGCLGMVYYHWRRFEGESPLAMR